MSDKVNMPDTVDSFRSLKLQEQLDQIQEQRPFLYEALISASRAYDLDPKDFIQSELIFLEQLHLIDNEGNNSYNPTMIFTLMWKRLYETFDDIKKVLNKLKVDNPTLYEIFQGFCIQGMGLTDEDAYALESYNLVFKNPDGYYQPNHFGRIIVMEPQETEA